jgi:hypothetical protein
VTTEIERPLTAPQVAEVLGMHVNSVKRIPPVDLPYFRVGSRGDRRYEIASVIRYKSKRYTRR